MIAPQRFLRAASILAVARIAQQGLLFVQLALFLFVFGSDATTDAWNMARALPFFFAILFKYSLSQLFIPVFNEWRIQKSDEEAWKLTSLVLAAILLFLLATSLFMMLVAPFVPRLLAPGLDAQHQQLCGSLLRYFSVFIAVSGLCGIPHAVYYSYHRFAVPAFTSVFVTLSTIAAIYFLSDEWGIHCVPAGALAGASLELLVSFLFLNVGERRFRFRLCFSHPGATQFLKLLGPRMITVALAKVSMVVDQSFASLLGPASISALTYADRINQAPAGLVGSSVGTVSFSELSDVAARQQFNVFKTKLERHICIAVFISTPITVLLLVLSEPLISTLFKRGAFGGLGVQLTATAVSVYSLGLFPLVITATIRGSLYALQKVAIPLKVSIFQFVLNIVLNFTLIGPLGLGGLALATAISQWATMILLYHLFCKAVGFRVGRHVYQTMGKLGLAALTMALILTLLRWGPLADFADRMLPATHIRLAAICLAGMLVYLIACLVLRVEETTRLLARLRGVRADDRDKG